ncbi:MAG: hypothetical protein V1704_03010 [Candidatus Vogelbacteria bacterium]
MQNDLPIFLKDLSTKKILGEVRGFVPKDTKIYLFGGAVRNAIYFKYFDEEIIQRDYDCVVIGNGEMFANNLVKGGFVFGSKNFEKAKIFKKARISNPVHKYNDWLYLDCKIFSSEERINSILEKISDLTISGVALDIQFFDSINWISKIIAIPKALDDIKEKKLRLVNPYPINFYKIIRLVSRGFQQPTKSDIIMCLEKLREITKERFISNTEKTIRYIGSEEQAIKISKELGATFNVFNFEEIKFFAPNLQNNFYRQNNCGDEKGLRHNADKGF